MRFGGLLLVSCAACDGIFDLERVETPTGMGDAAADGALDCPAEFGGSTHLFVATEVSWAAAEDYCRTLGKTRNAPGVFTHLVVGSDALELELPEVPQGVYAWVGISDVRLGGGAGPPPNAASFSWVTDEMSTAFWGDGEPDSDKTPPYCGYHMPGDVAIHDTHCVSAAAFVCECDGYPENPANVPPL